MAHVNGKINNFKICNQNHISKRTSTPESLFRFFPFATAMKIKYWEKGALFYDTTFLQRKGLEISYSHLDDLKKKGSQLMKQRR